MKPKTRLVKLLQDHNLTQQNFADHIGKSRIQARNIINKNEEHLDIGELKALSSLLKIPIYELMAVIIDTQTNQIPPITKEGF